MNELIRQILAAVHALIKREIPRLTDTNQWATVTQASPLRIRFDGQDDPLEATPGKLTAALIVGDRVSVRHRMGQNPLITGVAGGAGSGQREFQTLFDATAAGLPVGSQVWVRSESQGYVRVGAGFVRALVDDYSTGTLTPAVVTGTISWQRDGRVVMVRYDLTGVVGSDSEIVALPASIRPTALTPATEFQYGVTDNNPAYLSRVSLRIPGQIGTTRRVGIITYMVG